MKKDFKKRMITSVYHSVKFCVSSKLGGLLIIFFLLAISPAFSAINQNIRISIEQKNVSLSKVLDEIEAKTGYTFLVRSNDVNIQEKVSVDVKDKSLSEVLDILFHNRRIKYEITGKNVSVFMPSVQSTPFANEEKRKVTGIVLDAKGDPVIGANVVEKGTTNGTITDIDGRFSLEASPNTLLLISYIGYMPKEIAVDKSNNLKVKLAEDSQALEEVVVVGYGTQKKANLTGAVETVKSDKIDGKPVISLSQALAGEASGVTITQRSGQPGADQKDDIKIRGVGTWGNSSPLVLVDGVSMSINDVIPSDVESVSVLKDAASAAIYGSRAANGVILITTKKGKEGKVSLSYTGNVGFQTPTRTPQMVSSWQYAELYNQSMANEGKSSSLFPQDRIDRMRAGGDPDRLEGNTDWYDELLRSAALQHTHNITITGGGKNTTYMSSLGYSKQDGVIPTTAYERYNARVNTSTNITNWLKLDVNIAYINGQESESSAGVLNAFQRVGRSVPYMPVKYSDGTWSFLSAPVNAVRTATDEFGMRYKNNNNISTLISPEINPLPGLVIKGVFAYESSTFKEKKFEKTVEFDAFEPASQPGTVFVPRNQQTDEWKQYNNLTGSATVSYEKQLKKNYFKVMAGGSLESFKYSFTKASRKDFPNNDFSEINAGDPNTASAEGNSTYSALASLFGRINYTYADRYLFEANLRYDGSSKFARGSRWGVFPSFSLGWRISEEAFFENAKRYFSNVKLRGSWGKLGNQQIDDYQYFSTIGAGGNYLFNNGIHTGYKETLLGNSIITWESSKNLNIGLDVSTLNDRLQATFDWYIRTTDDILLSLKVPATLGIDAPMQNAGSVENKGWDLSLNWRDKIGEDFTYTVGFNLSDVKNKITDLKGYKSPTGSLTTRIEGQPIDAIYGWESDGICTTQEQYEAQKELMKTYNVNWSMGDLIIKDRNKDNKIDSQDKTVIGNSIPRFGFGLNLGFEYKKFDFSCFFQGVGKADGYVTEESIRPMGIHSARVDHYTDSFDPKSANPNTEAYYPNMYNTWVYNYANMSHWVQDASYIRLKNLQIGYTFNLPKVGIEKLRLMLSGQNLFTLTRFRTWDPETKVDTRNLYPNVAVYSFGVNVVF